MEKCSKNFNENIILEFSFDLPVIVQFDSFVESVATGVENVKSDIACYSDYILQNKLSLLKKPVLAFIKFIQSVTHVDSSEKNENSG